MSDFRTVQQLKGLDRELAIPFRGIYILRRKTSKTARNGNPFLNCEFGDSTGSFSANCFGDSPLFAALDPVEEGIIVRIAGTTEYYNDRFSPRLTAGEILNTDEAIDEGALDQLIETHPKVRLNSGKTCKMQSALSITHSERNR